MVSHQVNQKLSRLNHYFFLVSSPVYEIFVRIGTLPYYRLYQFNTKDPIAKIAVIASEQPRSFRLVYAVTLWRARKLTELQFISIACTVLAAAVIGSFSWTTIEEAYWITHGLWHGSLVLSVLGILLAAQQVAVLNFLGPLPSSKRVRQVDVCLDRYLPVLLSHDGSQYHSRKKMVFTWQCPLMFMSYSVCAFLAGLTVLVCTPLIHRDGGWNEGCNIAVMYLTICAVAGATFVFCGFWIYHYVDLGFDVHDDDREDEEIESLASNSPRDAEFSPSESMPQAFNFSEAVSCVMPGPMHRT